MRSTRSVPRVGKRVPRLFTPPLRPLNRATTRGYEVIDFAEAIGEPLDPWEKWLVIHAMELNHDGTYRFRIVLTLVARQNGKSHVKRIVSLWRLYMDGARTVLGIAQDVALAREQMGLCMGTIFDAPDLAAEFGGDRKVNGDEQFWLLDPGRPKAHRTTLPRYIVRASNEDAARGLTIDELNIDELRTQKDWKAWAAVSKTVLARPYAQIWLMSNMGDDEAVVLNGLRDRALSEADPTIGIFEWSGPPGCALDDLTAIAQANPNMGIRIAASALLSAAGTDPPNVFRSEVLCQGVDQLDGAVDIAAWKACGDAAATPPSGRNVVACFDMAPGGEHATLAVAQVGHDGLVRTAIRKAWTSSEEARAELPAMLAELKPLVFVWYPAGPAAALATILRPQGKDGKLQPGRITVQELRGGPVGEACQGLSDLAKARGLVHNEDPLVNAHVTGAQKQMSADGWRFVRRGVGHVDAAYAIAGAVHVALSNPRRQLKMRSVS